MTRTLFLVLGLLALGGCSDVTLHPDPGINGNAALGSIQGRVCDTSGRTWLPDAMVYTYLYDQDDMIYETRTAYSDRDGYWLLDDLPAFVTYQVYITYGSEFSYQEEVYVDNGEDVELEEPACFDPLEMDVAVITGDYDDFQLVLQDMGFANYELIDGLVTSEMKDFLLNLPAMQFFDIIFFNGGHLEEDIIYDLDGSLVPDGDGYTDADYVRANIRAYVDGGGSMYASDWAYDDIEQVWPDQINFVGDDGVPDAAQTGEYQIVNAAVSDASLATFLETNYVSIEYDLPVWPPIENADSSVSTHMSASVDYRLGTSSYTQPSSPILVSFSSGNGKVVFSTFRVAKNASSEMLATLQYMMYNL